MRRAIARVMKPVGTALLWLLILMLLASVIVPRFLDRIYYQGPESGHFDGERFFNPDGEMTYEPPPGGPRVGFVVSRITGRDGIASPWPERVAVTPARPAPRVDGGAMVATWIGHATFLVQADGLNILTDPIWSARAGPFGIGPLRVAEPGIRFGDLPRIDIVVVSHNHYDHMDLATLERLWERDRPAIVTSLGNDSVIAQAGVRAIALDWGQRTRVGPAEVIVNRNHHWGSRWFTDRNRALWSSFVVRLPSGNLFFAGDTGFGDGEWPREAARHGPVRLALVPIGAFRFAPGQMGTTSHIGPREAVKVVDRLGATRAIGMHWGTFRLSSEGYDTPPRMTRLIADCAGVGARFGSVAIGRPVAVPPASGRFAESGDARIDACAARPEVQALR